MKSKQYHVYFYMDEKGNPVDVGEKNKNICPACGANGVRIVSLERERIMPKVFLPDKRYFTTDIPWVATMIFDCDSCKTCHGELKCNADAVLIHQTTVKEKVKYELIGTDTRDGEEFIIDRADDGHDLSKALYYLNKYAGCLGYIDRNRYSMRKVSEYEFEE